MEYHYTDGTEPTTLPHFKQRVERIPLGCTQQGRFPHAAEAATEVGTEDDGYGSQLWSFAADEMLSLVAMALVALAMTFSIFAALASISVGCL